MIKKKNQSSQKFNLNLKTGKLLYDNVLVKPIIEDDDGMVIKPQQYEDKIDFGEVLLVGEGRIFDNGTVVPLKVKVGDIIFFQKYSATKMRNNGEDLLLIREEDIYEILGTV